MLAIGGQRIFDDEIQFFLWKYYVARNRSLQQGAKRVARLEYRDPWSRRGTTCADTS